MKSANPHEPLGAPNPSFQRTAFGGRSTQTLAAIGGTVSNPTADEVVREFWRRMATNDFSDVAQVLSPEFVLEWPQSKVRIRGAERFARMNSEYPAHGRW